jgi:hypothetical protein
MTDPRGKFLGTSIPEISPKILIPAVFVGLRFANPTYNPLNFMDSGS